MCLYIVFVKLRATTNFEVVSPDLHPVIDAELAKLSLNFTGRFNTTVTLFYRIQQFIARPDDLNELPVGPPPGLIFNKNKALFEAAVRFVYQNSPKNNGFNT